MNDKNVISRTEYLQRIERYLGKQTTANVHRTFLVRLNRFTHKMQPIGVAEFNDPVRNGKGWDLSAITT